MMKKLFYKIGGLKNLLFAGLVPCVGFDTAMGPPAPGEGTCNWDALFQLGNNLLNWLIIIAVPIATITIAYAGWLFVTGGANSSTRSKAKSMLWSVLIGLAAVLAAALIIKAILNFLVNDDPVEGYPAIQNLIG